MVTVWAGPSQLGAAVPVGVTSNVTEPIKPVVLNRAAAPVKVAEKFPLPTWFKTAPVIAPVIPVTFQANVLATVDVKTREGVPPLQMVVEFKEVMVGVLLTVTVLVMGVGEEQPDVLTSLTEIIAEVTEPKSTEMVPRPGPLAALVMVAPVAVQL
jgi:hypothetical protein